MPANAAETNDNDFAPHKRIPFERPICTITFRSCGGSTVLSKHDHRGHMWLRIQAPHMPVRYLKLLDRRGLQTAVEMYTYIDGDACLNDSHSGTFRCGAPTPLPDAGAIDGLTSTQIAATGVPQRTYNSGLCWYAALCHAMFFSPTMRRFLFAYMDDELRKPSAASLS